jgi:hypothetical protein
MVKVTLRFPRELAPKVASRFAVLGSGILMKDTDYRRVRGDGLRMEISDEVPRLGSVVYISHAVAEPVDENGMDAAVLNGPVDLRIDEGSKVHQ